MKTLKEQLEEFKLAQLSNKNHSINDVDSNKKNHCFSFKAVREQLEKYKLEHGIDAKCDLVFFGERNNSHCKDCVDCNSCSCCYDCNDCHNCYLCNHCVDCSQSNQSLYCNDCHDIDNCLFCDGISGKYKQVSKRGRLIHCQDVLKYYVFNIKRTKTEYFQLLNQAKKEGLI